MMKRRPWHIGPGMTTAQRYKALLFFIALAGGAFTASGATTLLTMRKFWWALVYGVLFFSIVGLYWWMTEQWKEWE
jgi:hypothetical protein